MLSVVVLNIEMSSEQFVSTSSTQIFRQRRSQAADFKYQFQEPTSVKRLHITT